MKQAKFSLTKNHIEFLDAYKKYGFKDKSTLIRVAIDRLMTELKRQRLENSAEQYADLYDEDEILKDWNGSSTAEWPE